ncbi:MAG: hypothetical protein KAR07_08625 [Spirochaetes bacterium]|nr:hypothetical protein [Spirochaetota bacterium]MCK5268218.1 hypothetical protein [Spirochaetota bacterium]
MSKAYLYFMKTGITGLTDYQFKVLNWSLLYRLKKIDFFLFGIFISAISAFIFRENFNMNSADLSKFSVAVLVFMVIPINRFAYILSGRGSISRKRLIQAVGLLSSMGDISIMPFCLKTGIPFHVFSSAFEESLAESYNLGYINVRDYKAVVIDNPLEKGQCPVCKAVISENMAFQKVCSFCDTVFFI